MRFLKIILILFSLLIIGSLILVTFEGIGSTDKNAQFIIAYIIILIVLSIITILYQIKSFRFYRREEKQNIDKKLAKFLWVGAVSFYSFLLFMFGQGVYNNWNRYWSGNLKDNDFLFVSILFIPAIIGLMEISFLKKRIKQLKLIRDTKEEIDDIGASTF